MTLITGQFNDSYVPLMDGVVNVVKNYAYWLNFKHGRSCVVAPSFPQYEDEENFDVLRYFSTVLPKRSPYRLGIPYLAFNFKKNINKIPFNLVHAHCPFSSGQVALKIARRRNVPIVATFHSKYHDDFKEALRSENLTKIVIHKIISFYNAVDAVWTVNTATVGTLRSYGLKCHVEVIPNGTDMKPVFDRDNIGLPVRNMLNLERNIPLLLFVGQHIWQKNLKTLIHALLKLKNLGVPFHMAFVGKGCAEKDLKNLCNKLGLQNEITFLGQITDRDYLRRIYAAATLLLFPSIYDNAPLVVGEAASAGCPALLVKGSNSAEGIDDGYNGFLSCNDDEAYAFSIRTILSSPCTCMKAGENARKTLYRDWEQIVDEVAYRYMKLIEEHEQQRQIL